jgi:predicted class III extradiol MEMO1 family dioxygenase
MAEISQPPPPFDPSLPHQMRPKLRAVRGFPASAQGPQGKPIQVLGLADAKQVSPKLVFTQPAMQLVLPHLDGRSDLDEIVRRVGQGLERRMLEPFIAQLDDAGLIEGPTFQSMWSKMRSDFDSASLLPPAQTAAAADALVEARIQGAESRAATDEEKQSLGGSLLSEQLERWMNEAVQDVEDPSLASLPRGIIAPSLPYANGYRAYGMLYGRMRVVDRPDRILILGTNHFGDGTGVVGCDKGFRTPVGVSPYAEDLGRALRSSLGDVLFEHRYDHEREHSVELQCAWLQRVFGEPGDDGLMSPPVFAALVHDPSVRDGGSYDGQGVDFEPFVSASIAAIDGLPGRTLVVGSAELSHVGAAYGDQVQLAGQSAEADANRRRVLEQDSQLLAHVIEGRPRDLVASLAWQQNSTRWSSAGSIVAASLIARSGSARLLSIGAVMDGQGAALITAPVVVLA